MTPAEQLLERAARAGHEAYEKAAKANGWTSQTPVAWEDLPEANRQTTLAAYREVIRMTAEACAEICSGYDRRAQEKETLDRNAGNTESALCEYGGGRVARSIRGEIRALAPMEDS